MKRPSPALIGILTAGVVLAGVLLIGMGCLEARLEARMDQGFEDVERRFEAIEQRIEQTEARLATVEARLATVEEGRPKLHLLDKPR